MGAYAARRVLLLVPTVVVVTTLVFVVFRLVPGNPTVYALALVPQVNGG